MTTTTPHQASPVATLPSFQAVLALAARYDWEIESFDFNRAFLNGELEPDEEIYTQATTRIRRPGARRGKAIAEIVIWAQTGGTKGQGRFIALPARGSV